MLNGKRLNVHSTLKIVKEAKMSNFITSIQYRTGDSSQCSEARKTNENNSNKKRIIKTDFNFISQMKWSQIWNIQRSAQKLLQLKTTSAQYWDRRLIYKNQLYLHILAKNNSKMKLRSTIHSQQLSKIIKKIRLHLIKEL